jgi:FAD/FMN-containing dehydrogenase
VETALDRGWIVDGVSSQNERQSRDLWSYREEISEALSQFKPFKSDVSVRISRVGGFVSDLERDLPKKFPDLEVVWFGHLGDGNLHINVLNPGRSVAALSDWLFELVQKHEGSISAEHGIGLFKRDALLYTRSEVEVELMRGIKRVFDPDSILNPGKIFRV